MTCKLAVTAALVPLLAWAQTQVDQSSQIKNRVPDFLATDFAGADIGEKINNAFASFGAGRCGTVGIPPGSYTFSTTIYVRTGCILEGAGRGNDQLPFGTRLLYNGPPATAAIVMMNPDFTPGAAAAMNSRQVFVDRALTSFCSASASAIRPPLPTGSTSTRLETTEPSITGFDRHEVQHCRVAEQPLSRRFAAE